MLCGHQTVCSGREARELCLPLLCSLFSDLQKEKPDLISRGGWGWERGPDWMKLRVASDHLHSVSFASIMPRCVSETDRDRE